MSISVVGTPAVHNSGTTTPTTNPVTFPSGCAAADLGIFNSATGVGTAQTVTGPSGWSQQSFTQRTVGESDTTGVWTKSLSSGDISTGTVGISSTGSGQEAADLLVLRGGQVYSASTPISETNTSGSAPFANTIPQVTPPVDNCMLVCCVTGAPITSNRATVFTPPSGGGWTMVATQTTSTSARRLAAVIFYKQLGTGTAGVLTTAETFTTDDGYDPVTTMLVIQPTSTTQTITPSGIASAEGFGHDTVRRAGDPSVSTMPVPTYAAHQGGAAVYPAETMTAYNLALPGKKWLVGDTDGWLDSQGTSTDANANHVIMYHNSTDDSDGTTLVTSYTDAGWAATTTPWPVGPNSPVARSFWHELADGYGADHILTIEFKDSSQVDTPILNDIRARGLMDSVIVQCFTLTRVQAAAALGFHALWDVQHSNVAGIDYAATAASGVEFIAMNQTDVTSTIVASAHAVGLKIWAYTIDTTTQRDAMLALGIDGMWMSDPSMAIAPPALAQTISPSGIASAEAFGSDTVSSGSVTLAPSGIASGEALGVPTITTGPVTVSPSGIASAEAFGADTLSSRITLLPSGIATAEAFGADTLSPGPVTLLPGGIASGEAFGAPSMVAPQLLSPSGIASAEGFGVPLLIIRQTLAVVGIPSAEGFGNTLIFVAGSAPGMDTVCRTTHASSPILPHITGASGLRYHWCTLPLGHGGTHLCLCGARY